MQNTLSHARGRIRGFTLIELMIVVVIVGILAAIAYPSYQNQVQKTRRTDGKVALMETAQRLERCYTRFGTYTDSDCNVSLPLDSAEEFYEVDEDAANGGVAAGAFALAAVPQGAQADDTECGTLQLTHAGEQGTSGSASADDCW